MTTDAHALPPVGRARLRRPRFLRDPRLATRCRVSSPTQSLAPEKLRAPSCPATGAFRLAAFTRPVALQCSSMAAAVRTRVAAGRAPGIEHLGSSSAGLTGAEAGVSTACAPGAALRGEGVGAAAGREEEGGQLRVCVQGDAAAHDHVALSQAQPQERHRGQLRPQLQRVLKHAPTTAQKAGLCVRHPNALATTPPASPSRAAPGSRGDCQPGSVQAIAQLGRSPLPSRQWASTANPWRVAAHCTVVNSHPLHTPPKSTPHPTSERHTIALLDSTPERSLGEARQRGSANPGSHGPEARRPACAW